MVSYQINGSELILSNGRKVGFVYPIAAAVSVDPTIVVLLDIPYGVRFNRNVYGIGEDGGIRWQVQDVFRDPKFGPFGSIDATRDRVTLAAWSGVVVDLDPRDGKVLREYMQQR